MELKNYFAQDDAGNILSGATCYLYVRGTESLVEGLLDASGLALDNPFVSDQQGLVQFAAPNGLYDLRVVKGSRDNRLRMQCNDVTDESASRALEDRLANSTDPSNGPGMMGFSTPDAYVNAKPHTMANYLANCAYQVEGHMTDEEWADFSTGTGMADHSAAFVKAITAAAANRSIKHVVFGSGNFKFPDGPPIDVPASVSLRGPGMSEGIIKKVSDQFVFNIVTLGLVHNTASLSHFQIQAKNGICNRSVPGSDYVNTANPTRTSHLHDLKLVGTYIATADPKAGSAVVPTRAELEALGVGINSVMQYGVLRERIYFDNFGIALASIGDTLSRTISCWFNNNARHIHDERTAWYGSAFGMGADNVYESNDLLDGRRVGGVTFINSFGGKFRGNYLENLTRGGAASAPESLMQINTSRMRVTSNHINPTLSSTSGRPFYIFSADSAVQPDTGGNITESNYFTPSSIAGGATVSVSAGFNVKCPNALIYRANTDWPAVNTPNVMLSSPSLDKFGAQSMPPDTIGGAMSANTDLWQPNGVGGSFVKTVNSPLVIFLTAENPTLTGKFSLIFDADDNATGNGRLFVTVTDSDGATVLHSANAFAGVLAPGKYYLTLTSAILESRKRLRIECGNFSFAKVYGIRLEPMQFGFATATAINPALIAVGASEAAERTFTIAGAEVGDDVKATFSLDTKGLTIPARISAANTVSYYFHNPAGNPNGAQDLGSGSVYFQLTKRKV